MDVWLAPAWQLQGREGKYLLKKALQAHLPSELLYRSKMGFSVPWASWFREPLQQRLQQALLGGALRGGRRYFAPIWIH
jgi:asparagine synthase (glutamine-hydrolysing)